MTKFIYEGYMADVDPDWDTFVSRYKTKLIRPRVNLNLGHALIIKYGPKHWKRAIRFYLVLGMLAIPTGIVLFFFLDWWISVLVIIGGGWLLNTTRRTAAEAVIEISLEDNHFYALAILSETMIVEELDYENNNDARHE